MNISALVVYCLWFLSELFVATRLRSTRTDKQHADKRSLPFIWITIVVALTVAVFTAMYTHLPLYQTPWVYYLGLALLSGGILFRVVTIVSLGRLFTADVTIRENHTLKKGGPYRYLRHPSYSASLLSFVGFGITLANWLSLLILVTAVVTAFSIRIKIEEKVLIDQFGTDYIAYKKSTSGLIPFIY